MDDDEEENGARAAPSPRPPGDALVATCEASTRVGADGSVTVAVADLIFRTADAAKAAWPPLPRLGLALRLPPSVGDVAWLGLGPHECYPDRKAAALFGAFCGTVDDLFVPYLRPSECGNRTGVERLALASPSLALGIAADFGAFDFSAGRHGDRDLVEAGAAKESEIPNFKGSYLGRFPLVLADCWTSDHLSERPRSVDVFFVTRARGTLTLKRR